jgi:hypothetical protein
VWNYVRESGIRIIHIKRRNLLDRYLSHKLAEKSGAWALLKKQYKQTVEPIILDASDCVKNFHQSEFWQKQADDFFKNNPKSILFFEYLCEYLNEESKKIQEFLSLEPQELTSITIKQQTKKKSEVIKNFDELKRQFIVFVSKGWAREEWIDFFDET